MNLVDIPPPHRPIAEIALDIADKIWEGTDHRWTPENHLMIWGTVAWTAKELDDNIMNPISGFDTVIGTLKDEWIVAYKELPK